MLVVEFEDKTRAVLQDHVARAIVGTDFEGDVLVRDQGKLWPLTPCCHHRGVATKTEKSGAVCAYCEEEVEGKYAVPAPGVYTRLGFVCSIETAMRNTLPTADDEMISRASQYLVRECVEV